MHAWRAAPRVAAFQPHVGVMGVMIGQPAASHFPRFRGYAHRQGGPRRQSWLALETSTE